MDFWSTQEYRGMDPSTEGVEVTAPKAGWFGTASSYAVVDVHPAGDGDGDGDSSDDSEEDELDQPQQDAPVEEEASTKRK